MPAALRACRRFAGWGSPAWGRRVWRFAGVDGPGTRPAFGMRSRGECLARASSPLGPQAKAPNTLNLPLHPAIESAPPGERAARTGVPGTDAEQLEVGAQGACRLCGPGRTKRPRCIWVSTRSVRQGSISRFFALALAVALYALPNQRGKRGFRALGVDFRATPLLPPRDPVTTKPRPQPGSLRPFTHDCPYLRKPAREQ
jgi:hypothetical protein